MKLGCSWHTLLNNNRDQFDRVPKNTTWIDSAELDFPPRRMYETSAGPTLILVHGSNCSLQSWDGLQEQLRKEFRVISVDLPPSRCWIFRVGRSASKSKELAEALSGGKKIVVCPIQTFPFALKAVQELAATQGKRFAVIADEAQSSQTGSAANLKAVLSAEELQELADDGEVSTENLHAAQMAARANDAGITYVASKTLELFGCRPNPALPAGPENLPAPFHVYSMRQAIEEGFILDVLKNSTPYGLAFKLASEGCERQRWSATQR